MNKIALIGFGFAGGQKKKGTRYAFETLMRDNHIKQICSMYGVRTVRLDPECDERDKYEDCRFACSSLHGVVLSMLRSNYFPIVVGGDHSLAIGSISAAKSHYRDLKVVWVDAHADINTDRTSTSGNIHGMPLAALGGMIHHFGDPFSCLRLSEDLMYVGVRDCDPAETELVSRLNLPILPDMDSELNQQMYRRFARNNPIWTSVDVDALDSSVIKATGTPVANGLSEEQLSTVLDVVLADSVGLDIAELNFEESPEAVQQQIDICSDLLVRVIRQKTINELLRY